MERDYYCLNGNELNYLRNKQIGKKLWEKWVKNIDLDMNKLGEGVREVHCY